VTVVSPLAAPTPTYEDSVGDSFFRAACKRCVKREALERRSRPGCGNRRGPNWSLEGSNPSPSADNPDQRLGASD